MTAPTTLVCDYGSLWTKASLFASVEHAPRLVATVAVPTVGADDSDSPDLLRSLHAAQAELTRRTGLSLAGSSSEEAVALPRFLPVGSAAPPLQVVVIGFDRGAARRVAQRLRGASYLGALISGSLSELLAPGVLSPGLRPDAVLLVEGQAGSASGQMEALAEVLARVGARTRLVPVLHCCPAGAGGVSSALLSRLYTEIIVCDLTQKGQPGVSAVRSWLNRLYADRSLGRSPGALHLNLATGGRFISSIGAQAITTRFAATCGSVLSLDVGASNVAACFATGEDFVYGVLPGVGVGTGIAELYGRVGEANLRRWLPFEPRPDEVRTWVLNRSIEPTAVALTLRESLIEQAAIREALRLAIEEIAPDEPPALLIGSGAPARAVGSTLGAVLLLDALSVVRPRWRQVDVALDSHNVLTALGALASLDPDMAGEVWELDAPIIAATAVSARGAKRGMPAVLVTARWGETVVENHVPEGVLHPVQPPASENLVVELAPQRGVQVEGARRKQPARLDLPVSARNPLPQLLLDTRRVSTGGGARAAAVATNLSSSRAYPARDLERL